MNISFVHKLVAAVMSVSLSPQGALAASTQEVLEPATQYQQEWLSIDNMEERQSFDVDRGELCKYLVSTYSYLTNTVPVDAEALENPFVDIQPSSMPYVVQASSLGLASVAGENFEPTRAVTKGELAGMIYNMVGQAYPNAVKGDKAIAFYEDVPSGQEKALSFAFTRGLILKQGNGKIGADANVTLGELATILNRTVAAAPYYPIVNNTLSEKRAYLTFDDGTSQNTVKILDTLKKYNVKATFFVTGRSDPALLRRIRDEGHVIGNHTMTHNYQNIYATPENFWQDFEAEQDYLLNVLGDASMYMRFPGGSNNSIGIRKNTITTIQAQAKEKGYIYVDWNVDSGDATGNTVPKDKIVQNVLNGSKNKTDAVILMHQTKPKTTTAEALPEIIEGLQAMGFELDSLDKSAYYPRFMK